MEGKEAMVFHGNQWGWRAMAVRLLLAPVVAAGVAVPAVAQTSSQPQRPASAQVAPRNGDPKELLQQGRDALKAGQLDRAQDLAKQSDATNASGRWGLFDDTPESLEKDILAARVKVGKADAERLTKAAKELFVKPAKTAGERIANLDQAYTLADQAQAKAGPSDFFDDLFGSSDRPEKLKKEIDATRAALRKANPGVVATAKAPTATRTPTTPNGVQQAGAIGRPTDAKGVVPASGIMPPAPMIPVTSANPRLDAMKLVADGRTLLRTGKLVEAKAKAAEALRLNATFTTTEDSPASLARDVMTDGKSQVDFLVRDAENRVVNKEFAKAEDSLTKASTIASGLGFQTRPIEDQLTTIRRIASGDGVASTIAANVPTLPALSTLAPAIVVPAVESKVPEIVTNLVSPVVPSLPVTTVTTPTVAALTTPALPGVVMPTPMVTPAAPTPVVPTVATALTGAQLLTQARVSLRTNDLEMARKLAVQSFNADTSAKAEAQELLREIDAESSLKQRTETTASFKNAVGLFQQKQYDQAIAVFKILDADKLTTDQKKEYESICSLCETEVAKQKVPSAPVTTVQSISSDPVAPKPVIPGILPTPQPAPGTGLTDQVKAQGEVEFQRLRSEGLESEAKARDLYNKGETDVAIQMLNDFTNKVKSSTLSPNRQSMLLTSVSRRLEGFQIMKRQMDFYKSEATNKIDSRTKVVGKQLAEAQKQDDIKKKVTEVNELMKKKSYRQAEELALQVKSMDPDDPTLNAIYEMTKRQRRVEDYAKLKSDKEQMFLDKMNDAERVGPSVDTNHPLHVDPERAMIARLRGTGSELYFKSMSPAEREIEVKLERPMSVEFPEGTTLRGAINSIRSKAGLNITTDDASINGEQISLDQIQVSESLKDLSLRNVLTVLLDKASLKYVVENDVIRITTEKKARGKLYTKVFSVMELVTPIPDFALAPHQSVAKALAGQSNPNPAWETQQNGSKTFNPNSALGGGELRSGQMPSYNGLNGMGGSALLQNDNKNSPMASSATLANSGRSNHSAQLMRLITGMVKPYSWADVGGAGKLDYFDIGGALVVNQTADVIREVQDLLEALRKLQEVSVSVEIRVISLSESFFERIGVDFAMNIKTKNRGNFEQSLTTGQFAPEPFINSINAHNVTVGYNPTAGGFTPDLNVPVRTNSFGLGVPAFGGYPGPGNGGLGLGLAFLNDIQVFMFMEAASGDRRVNIMQAPKITLFNGQTSTVFVSDFAFFTTGLDVINVGGQFVYIPRNVPIPVGNSPSPPGVQAGNATPGVTVTVQAIVSADRRFVRLNMAPTLTSLTSATVPLFPVTAFITPVFEGGSQGVPIPFTQFFQQPSISEINVQTTVAIPDGGTVVLGGLKTLAEGRNEFGPPVLSQIPYVNRLFRNQGIGRETRHIMIMVTPRIIIQSEEEFNQTGSAPGITAPNQ